MKRLTWDRIDETGATWKYLTGTGKCQGENGDGTWAVGGEHGPNMAGSFWAGNN
jgi:hypothetical protein